MTVQFVGGGSINNPPAYERLITRYIHNLNPAIQPTALDMTTGIFTTSSPHGLSVNDNLVFVFNSNTIDLTKTPYEWGAQGANLQVNTVVSSTQFTLKCNGTAFTSYPSANNTALDCTQYHFESVQAFTGGITINGFQTTALNVKIRGFVSDGDCYLSNGVIRSKSWQSGTNTSVFGNGWALSSNATHACFRFANIDAYLWLTKDGRVHLRGDCRQTKITSTRTLAEASPTAYTQYAFSLSQIPDSYFSDITFGYFQGQCLANNGVFEVYDIS